ncbi:ABC transporter ATP-binding protein [uncultured Desulfuromusa sp.]|uniref:ABC transporter ATP-binding protein n=1 Tax=uncultured Desulfuromusa sp. TaxID=219183 RepID=UPI002AA6AF4E|nr:ABC transporter ATP-binding protein [uncultured Desulfuromusa sp.]
MNSPLKIVHCQQQPEPAPPLLKVEKLGRSFISAGNGRNHVLQNVSFSAQNGEFLCILGRSGCGKTTLLKLLAGFISPGHGTISLNNQPVCRPGPERCVVFQEDALFPWLTVRENIAFGLSGKSWNKKEKNREIDRFLDLVGLSDFGSYLPHEISGGMKQRVALARVLILNPRVLLMDEPFAALDAQTREEMQNLLLELWREFAHTILFVTHDVSEAVLLADRILLFDKNPGTIQKDVSVALPRPRETGSNNFISCCRDIKEQLKIR